MTLISNITSSNASVVFTNINAYTSIEVYYAVLALLAVSLSLSLLLAGDKKPFEKLFAAIMAFIFSALAAYESFSLAIVSSQVSGFIGSECPYGQTSCFNMTQQNVVVPVISMQNSMPLQIVSWIFVIMCFVNIINCILVLMDYSRIKNVNRGAL